MNTSNYFDYLAVKDYKNVCIILDLDLKQISFQIDGKSQGVAFKDVKCDDNIYYRLAVSFGDKGDKIELVNYRSEY